MPCGRDIRPTKRLSPRLNRRPARRNDHTANGFLCFATLSSIRLWIRFVHRSRPGTCGNTFMTEEATPAGPAPMEGHGGYNRRSAVQACGASPALPLLEQAAREAALPAGDATVVVADYGSSEGRNSLAPMAAAIGVLRARTGPARAVSVVHTDLPGNDFGALFQLLATDPASYLRDDPAVFASAIGRSFYEQLLPPASVTLGWSAWAVQWLGRTPAPIPDHVQVACSRDEAAREAYARQAARDWETFLACRSRELHPGGRLVVLTMARTDEGDFGYRAVLAALCESLRALVAEGLVREEEAARMAIPTVGRTRAEFAAPFSEEGFAGLTLERIDIFEGEDTIWRDFARDGDPQAYGARWAAFSRASVLPTLALDLAGGAKDPRAAQFVTRLEAGMAERLAAAPEPTLIPLAALVLARRT
jgi:SAM dependent carboxyl methyltransferase